jgi:hypothetical protein
MKPGDLRVAKPETNTRPYYSLVLASDISFFWDAEDPEVESWYVPGQIIMLLESCSEEEYDTTFTFWRVLTAQGTGWCRETGLLERTEPA